MPRVAYLELVKHRQIISLVNNCMPVFCVYYNIFWHWLLECAITCFDAENKGYLASVACLWLIIWCFGRTTLIFNCIYISHSKPLIFYLEEVITSIAYVLTCKHGQNRYLYRDVSWCGNWNDIITIDVCYSIIHFYQYIYKTQYHVSTYHIT